MVGKLASQIAADELVSHKATCEDLSSASFQINDFFFQDEFVVKSIK